MTETSMMLVLRSGYQLVWTPGRKGRVGEIRDAARNGAVVFSGTYRQCVAEARRRGIWYS